MRYGLAFVFALAIITLLGSGDTDAAACRAAGDYRVTGQNVVGRLTLTETAVDQSASSGAFVFEYFPKQACDVCITVPTTAKGDYDVFPDFDGTCILNLNARVGKDRINAGGRLAFGGAVIMFEFYDAAPLLVDLNLTLGIRSDAFRP